jgi:gliding motility-associated-like protein
MRNLYRQSPGKFTGNTPKTTKKSIAECFFAKLLQAIILFEVLLPCKLFARVPIISNGSLLTCTAGPAAIALTSVVDINTSIATLSKLTVSNGTLSPAFATGTSTYTDVAHSVSSIAFRAITTDPLATETINGTAVPEGTVSPYFPLNAGVNNINVVVTAQDGVTKDTYTIAVTRLPGDATLSKLTVSSGALTPAFATGTMSYTDVAHSVSSIAFRAITTDPLATETINGTAVPEGTVSPYFPLNVGVNNISVVVTAQDGVTQDTYTIAVTRLPGVATLSKLTVSSGTLTPAFATGTTSYTDVAHSVSPIAFRAITTDPLATETINGTAVPEGTVSPYFPLNVGVNNISVVVTAQDGVTQDTYTIAVTRLPDIATLSKLTVSSGTLTPAFATGTTSYTDNVANTASSIAFRAITTDPLATETINGTAVPEGTVSPYIPLNTGLNTITIIVTAQDGVTEDTYIITVARGSNVATLSGLTDSGDAITPVFATGTTNYTDTVINRIDSVAVRATTTDPAATETINGKAVPEGTVSPYIRLNGGLNTITIVVTAQDGVTKDTYTIAQNREPSEIATLSKLTISSGTLTPTLPASWTTEFTDEVDVTVDSVAVRAITTDPTATETINGMAVPEGTVSPYMPLIIGQNFITIIVTAQDGITQVTYTIAVTRLPNFASASLSNLTVSSGTLSPRPGVGVTRFTDGVGNSVDAIEVRAPTSDPAATETINGIAVPEGTLSPFLPLNTGLNTITIIVTATDGVTKDTYTIVVTRESDIATLSQLTISSGTLTPAFSATTKSYTDNVINTITSVAVTASTTDDAATETINGTAVPEGTVSPLMPLNIGLNTITIIVTPSDGVTIDKDSYTISVTRAAGGANNANEAISVSTLPASPRLADDGIVVHHGVSPNGDGIDDFLQIDNIINYPDNRLAIMNRDGKVVYEAKGYDNSSRIFDGHSNKTGQMQLPGTYFYALDYTVKGIIKHQTGFIVLKY